MKASWIITLALMVTMVTGDLAEARGRCGNGNGQGQGSGHNGGSCQTNLATLPVEDLSDGEKESLVRMRQEEKLARDVYLTLGEKYNLTVFTNIPQAEQRHLDQMGQLLDRYGLDDPIADRERGVFASREMQALYDELVARGSRSEVEALTVGATIEDLDIYDLEKALAEDVDNQDVGMVYRNLAKGSRNHMRAFTTQLKTHGVEYEAQYIAQSDLEAIVSSDWERGPADGQGRGGSGKGKGNGRGQGHGRGWCQN